MKIYLAKMCFERKSFAGDFSMLSLCFVVVDVFIVALLLVFGSVSFMVVVAAILNLVFDLVLFRVQKLL